MVWPFSPTWPAAWTSSTCPSPPLRHCNPEGIKFFERHGRLFVLSANEVSGTVFVVEVLR